MRAYTQVSEVPTPSFHNLSVKTDSTTDSLLTAGPFDTHVKYQAGHVNS